MRGRPKAGIFMLAAIVAVFLSGVVHLFLLRFEAGDSYPAYSSLRADPLGSRALYESLGSLEEMTVSRNYRPHSVLRRYPGATLFLFGLPSSSLGRMSAEEAREIESFVLGGGRLVLLLYPEKPEAAPPRPAEKDGTKDEAGGGEREKDAAGGEPGKDRNGGRDADFVSLAERWKFGLSRDMPAAGADRRRTITAVPAPGAHGLTKPVSWHSSLRFDQLGPEWRPLYECDGKPVVIERTYGKGSVLIASDSYFASNEAMVKERRPELLARLAGPNSAVIFDETHFGIRESPGIAALGRKYRLHGLFSGLLLLAALFLWKNSSSVVPPGGGRAEEAGAQEGKDSLSGLAGLLRRTIPRGEILAACAEEWKKTNGKGPREAAADAALIVPVVESEAKRPARERDPVGAYRRIYTALAERKRTT